MKRMVGMILLFFVGTLPVQAGLIEEGQEIFKARCGLCHQLPDPGMLKPEQWRRLLDTKQKLMEKAGMPKLNNEEYNSLLAYLRQNAKK
jgi:mono/diheme cytochrome c family protein